MFLHFFVGSRRMQYQGSEAVGGVGMEGGTTGGQFLVVL